MTKKQKIWLGIFLAMFLIPEALWSPVGNIVYELTQTGQSGGTHPFRYTILQNSDNLAWLRLVFFIQLVGVVSSLIALFRARERNTILWISLAVLFCLSLVNILVLYLSFALSNISF